MLSLPYQAFLVRELCNTSIRKRKSQIVRNPLKHVIPLPDAPSQQRSHDDTDLAAPVSCTANINRRSQLANRNRSAQTRSVWLSSPRTMLYCGPVSYIRPSPNFLASCLLFKVLLHNGNVYP